MLIVHILGIIIPTDELIFVRGAGSTTNQTTRTVSKKVSSYFLTRSYQFDDVLFYSFEGYYIGESIGGFSRRIIELNGGFSSHGADDWMVIITDTVRRVALFTRWCPIVS